MILRPRAIAARLARRVGNVVGMLRRIGPDPMLLARYVVHYASSSTSRRALRATYPRRVAHGTTASDLQAWPWRLPRFQQLPEGLAEAALALRDEAENACAHRFAVLGSGLESCGEQIDWHSDFKSGFTWPRQFYQDLRVVNLADGSDPKVPWELNRSHHLLALARAACLFGEARYAEELCGQLEHWIAENPPGEGINWANTMEVALRATNWVWAIATVDAAYPIPLPLRRLLANSLAAHGRHIAANLEGSPYLRGNHYLADMLGLLAIGWMLQSDRRALRWLVRARRAFEREMRLQVLDDGVGFEASTAYHGLALEMFIIAHWLCAACKRPLSLGYEERLRRMLEFSRALRQPDGLVPLFGDNDSGRVLPRDATRKPTHDHLLWLGAATLGAERPLATAPDPDVAWTFGVDAWRRASGGDSGAAQALVAAFPRGGYYVLSDGSMRVVVRCGDVGQNGNGGHAHNDLLSFVVSLGEAVLVDPGCWTYTADPRGRNEARSTAMHNTVMVEGEEINPIAAGELFQLRQVATPTVERWLTDEQATCLQASHDGYRRLTQRIVHRRTFRLDHRSGRLRVEDELLGRGRCEAETFLHFASGIALERTANGGALAFTKGGRGLAVDQIDEAAPLRLREGKVSASYGAHEMAPVVAASISGTLPLRFGWLIEAAEQES